MTTTLNTLYPPQLETFMPSFRYDKPAKIWFKISSYDETKISLIQYIHVSMVDQRTNQNVFAGMNNDNVAYPQYYPVKFYPDNTDGANGDIRTGYDNDKEMYWVSIPPRVLKTNVPLKSGKTAVYNTKQYYKVQLRFDLTGSAGYSANDGYIDPTSYFSWSGSKANALKLAGYTNANENNFSEWSTGTLIKPILIPELTIQGFSDSDVNNIKPNTDTLISGSLKFVRVSDDTTHTDNEKLSWYQIKIMKNSIVYYDTDKMYSDNGKKYYCRIDTSMLSESNNNYKMQFTYETDHGYTQTISYTVAIEGYGNNQTNETYKITTDEENGSVILDIVKANHPKGSTLTIRRSSHRSNFTEWDLIYACKFPVAGKSIVIEDTTIESMTGYRYQIQYVNGNTIYAPQRTEIIRCDFYGGFFSDSERMLRVSFDLELSNRANAVNRTKTDTLGGQYPIFTQNSKLKYHTYSISGRISTEDNGELFLSKEELFGLSSDSNSYYNYMYNVNEVTSTDTSIFGGKTGSSTSVSTKRIQPNNDWLYEREYRDVAEEWLNNGKPKLFRSMTEGNMIIMLDGVSMTPDTALGRRLYSFSATMYEIGDGKNLDSIASFGLFNVIDQR